jgi:hypothetical protein
VFIWEYKVSVYLGGSTLPDGCVPGSVYSYTTGKPCNPTATTTQPTITLVRPNERETLSIINGLLTVPYNWEASSPVLDPYLALYRVETPNTIIASKFVGEGIPNGKNGFIGQWTLNASQIPPARYGAKVCYGEKNPVCDVSDSYFTTMYTTTATTTPPPSPTQSLRVASPNGGETFNQGNQIPFTLVYKDLHGPVLAYLAHQTIGNVMTFSYDYYGGTGTTTGVFFTNSDIPTGQYKITACDETVSGVNAPGKPLCDSSDNYFTIGSSSPFQYKQSRPLTRENVIELMKQSLAANATEAVKGFINILQAMTLGF